MHKFSTRIDYAAIQDLFDVRIEDISSAYERLCLLFHKKDITNGDVLSYLFATRPLRGKRVEKEAEESISKLGLSTRAYNVLRRRKIYTIEMLQEMSATDLYSITNLGPKLYGEIQEALSRYQEKQGKYNEEEQRRT